jgi:hypothetical protein
LIIIADAIKANRPGTIRKIFVKRMGLLYTLSGHKLRFCAF